MIDFLAAVARIAIAGSTESVRWPATGDVVGAAQRHGLIAQLDRALDSIEGVPAEARAAVRESMRASTRRALLMSAQLRKLVDVLRAAGIDVLPIKGPLLATTVYGDPAGRGVSSDLDLVVRPRDLDRAIDALSAHGYRRVEWDIDEHDREEWDSQAHLFPTEGALVELHTELIGSRDTATLDFEHVLARSEERLLFGTRMRVLAPEDLLIYLALHGARHMWSRLQWVCDIAALIRASPSLDRDAVMQRAESIDARKRVELAVRLSGLRPEEFRSRLVLRRMRDTLQSNDEPGLAMRFLYELAARETNRQRLTYLRRQLEPNARDRAWVSLPPRLTWLRWFIRPLRLLRSYGRGLPPKPSPATGVTISIVIPTVGRTFTLQRLLASIEEQTLPPWEIIVVDQNRVGVLSLSDSVVHVRMDEPNAAAARNLGFHLSRGTHVLFLDDDEVLEPSFVARVADVFGTHAEVRCLWPIVYGHGGEARALRQWTRLATGPAMAGTTLFPIARAGSGGVTFERAFFRRSGGYDDLLFRFGGMSEDWELASRMRRRGMTVWADRSLFLLHEAASSGGCATRSLPYAEARARCLRATLLRYRLDAGPPFRLGLRSLPAMIRFGFLSSLGRPDARRSVLRAPLRHVEMLRRAIAESRTFIHDNAARYTRADAVDHLGDVRSADVSSARPLHADETSALLGDASNAVRDVSLG